MSSPARVTYATTTTDDEELHLAFDRGIGSAQAELGRARRFRINGRERPGTGVHVERSPIDREVVIGEFAQAGPDDVEDAVSAAAAFAPAWAAAPWTDRVALLRRVASIIERRLSMLAAVLSYEVGKNRLEALGDVQEAAELIRYYCDEMERHQGFRRPMGRLSPGDETLDVMRPYGVWAVVSPFNFPLALAAGPVGAALVAGNTVVLKPSSTSALAALLLTQAFDEAGLPPGALHLVTGSGQQVGKALVAHPAVAGITFTGSAAVGMSIYRSFSAEHPKPAICEMGGKNPVIVGMGADLAAAAEGTAQSAFGFGGQKCSACSRAFIIRPLYEGFLERLVSRAKSLTIGNPLRRDVYLGPLIDEAAVARYEEAVAAAGEQGRVHAGRRRLTSGDLARGNYVPPAVVEVPTGSWVWRRELFAPVLAVTPVDSVEEALAGANDTEYGLTAGFFGHDPAEMDLFLEGIQAGVIYVNRRVGATTGAWPAVQPFGGWKGSGTAGRGAGGPHYLQQYLREQSRTIVSE
jgi:1-pyrroline-5-carboxylate dehydrogenase